jgi:two-component system alkaline phosphatase synthesis response regulator PhoP
VLTHILVVDDEPHIGRIIKTRLEQGEFAVTVADNGVEALSMLEQNSAFKLVILDLMLPGMSGLEVLRAVRSNAAWKELLVVVLTAAGQDAQFREAQQLGVSEFLTKPFSPRRLFAHVVSLTGVAETVVHSDQETSL